MIESFSASLVAVIGLVVVHLHANRLRFLEVIPRSRMLSMAGGMSVAYVFLRILPDLGRSELILGYRLGAALNIPRHAVYLVALLGLVVFYGMERLADRSRRAHRRHSGEDCPSPPVFWIGMVSYSIVNFAVGYLLVQRQGTGLGSLALFFLTMALWFIVNDYGLRMEYKRQYQRTGRWFLSAVVLLGWGTALLAPVPPALLSVALAFVAGGIVMNVLKEELPRERESRFWAFAAGAALYSALLLAAG